MPTNPQTQLSNAPAGPGSLQDEAISPRPILEGATEFEYVTVLNPLSVEFVGRIGQTRPVNTPFNLRKDPYTDTVTNTEQDAVRNYGLTLKNKDHTGKVNIINNISIPSGKTVNLLGNEAQVIVSQLVTEILQREGKRLMLADAFQRHEVEKRIIMARSSVNEILGRPATTFQQQAQEALDNLNESEKVDEQEFPELTRTTETITAGSGDSEEYSDTHKVRVGRPPSGKTKSSTANKN